VTLSVTYRCLRKAVAEECRVGYEACFSMPCTRIAVLDDRSHSNANDHVPVCKCLLSGRCDERLASEKKEKKFYFAKQIRLLTIQIL